MQITIHHPIKRLAALFDTPFLRKETLVPATGRRIMQKDSCQNN